ncbi:hypothetical protein H6B33_04880 [Gemmiger formicilis]|uniref:hypothetical protein n=1 Tax=Gemmiger TaxID=204475 RepID=UPI001302E603|nr:MULTISPECIES: hypothetical protein [Gemmiger]MBM6914739.1 hypothetical protein [Gemmiger formicilis]HIX32945.1 hypothetical protein [Candidatus Gemmiger avium]
MLKQFWASIREAMALDECRYAGEEFDDASDEFEDLPLQRRVQLCGEDSLIA